MTETTLDATRSVAGVRPRLRNRLARHALFRVLGKIQRGRLVVHDFEGRHVFGESSERAELAAVLRIADSSAYTQMALEGSVGAGRSYAEGLWTTDDLTAFIRLLARNRDVLAGSRGGVALVSSLLGRLHRWRRRNSLRGSRDNIGAHYDLSNDFFATFLDPTMMYSCAIFDRPGVTLEEASRTKLDSICRKLDLGPRDHLLEIGTGWGGLALHAARNYGCRVTTTTISREQFSYASERIRAEGLEERITLLDQDYRQLRGRFDKLVSVEMIEAVGPQYMNRFFEVCSDLLEPNGLMLLQAITIEDGEYERAARSEDFIKRFIFPGSCIPSVARMTRAVSERTDMRIVDLTNIGSHYATTLAHWRRRFLSRGHELERMGFDARFQRLWDFYFSYCEGGFLEGRIGDVHMVLAKPEHYPRTPSLMPWFPNKDLPS